MWLEKGVPPSKLVLGIAAYGQSYTLAPRISNNAFTITSGPSPTTTAKSNQQSSTASELKFRNKAASSNIDTIEKKRVKREDSEETTTSTAKHRPNFNFNAKRVSSLDSKIPDLTTATPPTGTTRFTGVKNSRSTEIAGIGSPAVGPGNPGRLRHLNGQLSFPEVIFR